MYLLDSNVISEVRKGDRCDPQVAVWYGGVSLNNLYISALVVGEVRKGIEQLRTRDPRQSEALERWLADVLQNFGDRILPVDARIAEVWGRMSADRPRPVVDTLLAATAEAHGFTLVTRNTADVEGLNVPTLDPFATGG